MRSTVTRRRSNSAKSSDPLVDTLERYVSDLRLLLDQAAEREKALLAMVQELIASSRREPVVVTRTPSAVPARVAPALPLEALNDSPEFDQKGDAEVSAADEKAFADAQREFNELVNQENAFRAARGAEPVELEVQ